MWECELCTFKNQVDLAAEEIPLNRDVLYATKVVTPQTERVSLVGEQPDREAGVVFCIDISGSIVKQLRYVSYMCRYNLVHELTPNKHRWVMCSSHPCYCVCAYSRV